MVEEEEGEVLRDRSGNGSISEYDESHRQKERDGV